MAKEDNVPKVPFSVCDRGAFIRKAFVACAEVNVPTYECVVYSIAYDRIEMMHIPVSEMGGDHNGKATQFYVDGHHVMGGPAQLVKTHLQWLRSKALESGATPDAIRLLSRATKPFTAKEEKDMAQKLATKNAPKAGNAKALKAAAAKTPVGKGGGRKGNADALARAREAKKAATGPDTRKITVLKKPHGAREGTTRCTILDTVYKAKTVQAAVEAGIKAGDVAWAAREGYIRLG